MKGNGKMAAYPRSKSTTEKGAGFTMIELLIVVAIIGILIAIGVPILNESREKARDSRRVSDLKQLEFALEVYYESHGEYPPVDGGTAIGEGGDLDTELRSFMGSVPSDPLSNENGDTYQYVYDDTDNSCGALVYAKTMEKPDINANADEVCPELGASDGYVIVLSSSTF